ncbi:hypothetical protein RQP46_008050 [Phenoliferia psychrophenolica]
MADLVPQIYHEKQDPGSMLCAQHALNNLLQSSLFTPQDLADIARRLDQLEQDQLDNDDGAGESHNYDDSGFFSIMVMEEALKVLGLRLVRWKSKEMVDFHDKPESMEGFVLNHQLHWYTIRRFGTETRWYNLDSCIPSATWISPMYLGLTLREAELQGYSILAVLPTDDALITGLPACPATTLALTLPAPSSTTSSYSRSSGASTNPFQGTQRQHPRLLLDLFLLQTLHVLLLLLNSPKANPHDLQTSTRLSLSNPFRIRLCLRLRFERRGRE